jgi:copper(I)-binding protein
VIIVRTCCLLLLACLCLPAHAALRVEEAWLRQPAPGQPGAAIYFRARNDGSAAVVVNAAWVKGAASAALHEHRHEDGMMRMREAPPQTVAPGATLVAEPGALHLMVFGLVEAPPPGALLQFCLRCTDGSEACGEAVVKGPEE